MIPNLKKESLDTLKTGVPFPRYVAGIPNRSPIAPSDFLFTEILKKSSVSTDKFCAIAHIEFSRISSGVKRFIESRRLPAPVGIPTPGLGMVACARF